MKNCGTDVGPIEIGHILYAQQVIRPKIVFCEFGIQHEFFL